MTETDAVVKPLEMPVKFLPYLEKYRIYKLFKDMTRDLVINLPKDHLNHMRVYLGTRIHSSKDHDRIIVLISPELKFGLDNVILHKFPNPAKEPDRFRTWLYAIGGDILALETQRIHDYRKMCHTHFDKSHITWSGRLSAIAVPTLYLKGLATQRKSMEIENNLQQLSTSQGLPAQQVPLMEITQRHMNVVTDLPPQPSTSQDFGQPRNVCNKTSTGMKNTPIVSKDRQLLIKELLRDLGLFVITRRCILDHYEKHDDYNPACVSPELLAEVARNMVMRKPIAHEGWLMFDHPCTLREARCLQQEGVLPTVTLSLMPVPPVAPPAINHLTPARGFFDQDYEGLKFAYKATLKEVQINSDDTIDMISKKCFNAVRACTAGAQGAGQGHHAGSAPGVYRVLLVGPRGSGRRTQASMLAKHFNLVYLHFENMYAEALELKDDLRERILKCGTSVEMKAEIVRRRLLKKDCIDYGWVLTGFPQSGYEFEMLDNMETPPNRILFLNADIKTCKRRNMARATDWCNGAAAPPGSGPRVRAHPKDEEDKLNQELDTYFSEALAEMRAAAGISAWEIDANENIDFVQTKLQAAVIAAPAFDIESCSQLRNVCGD